jgi:hypothetical protein
MTTIIPNILKYVIMVVPFFTVSPFDDCVTWFASLTRCYNSKSAYLWLLQHLKGSVNG